MPLAARTSPVADLSNPFAGGPPVDVDVLAATCSGLHRLAEQVLAAARFEATGRIGLVPRAGGLATPPFPGRDGEDVVVGIDGAELVVSDGRGERRCPIVSVRQAGEAAGVEPRPPTVYAPATPFEPDRPLDLDADAVRLLGQWWSFGAAALDVAANGAAAQGDDGDPRRPGPVVLWPEHFDLAATWVLPDAAGEDALNLGVSPGDDDHRLPYAYVGPWPRPEPGSDPWWNAPFGRLAPAAEFDDVEDLAELFVEGLRRTRPTT